MLVHDFVYVELPAAAVRDRFSRLAEADLPALGWRAYRDGQQLLGRLGSSTASPLLAKRVFLQVGPPREYADTVIVPLTWSASGASALFPRMDGDLELAPLGSDRTQLSFYGGYEPPLAGIGRRLDRLVLHRVAEATVRTLLHRLAGALSDAPEPVLTGESPPAAE